MCPTLADWFFTTSASWEAPFIFLPGESQGRGSLVRSMGSHRVGHDWSNLAAAAERKTVKYSLMAQWVKNALQCRRYRRCCFSPSIWEIPCRRKGQPIPIFLPEKSHGQRNLVEYSPNGPKESQMTKYIPKNIIYMPHNLLFFIC